MTKKFYYYLLKKGGGKIDPRNIDFMIEALEEWLPDEHSMIVEVIQYHSVDL
jgi:hypothetical protein